MKKVKALRVLISLILLTGTGGLSFSQQKPGRSLYDTIEMEIRRSMRDGDIPGLSMVIIRGDQQLIKNYGYADAATKVPVTDRTLFQLGSCSKAFTALAAEGLINAGVLDPEAYVSDFLPWFQVTYKGRKTKIKLLHLLHHTSGIPWQTIAAIPQADDSFALERTVKALVGVELHHLPGKTFEYATINYDVLALVIAKVTGQSFEEYVHKAVFEPLRLDHTSMGHPVDDRQMSKGYKIGFFRARAYTAPVYRGNNAAGYVISDAGDMARWLAFQMGLTGSLLYDLAKRTQQRDESVAPHDMSGYAKGWNVSLSGNGEIYHEGLNPNFSSYIAFRPRERTGVIILANSNSGYTPLLGKRIMSLLMREERGKEGPPSDGNDKSYSVLSMFFAGYTAAVVVFLAWVILRIITGKRTYRSLSWKRAVKFIFLVLACMPLLYALYLLPKALAGFTWQSILVWTPVSFAFFIFFVLTSLAGTYLAAAVSMFFPEKDPFIKIAPRLLLMSIIAGLSNMVLIILITSSIDSTIKLKYLLFYYILTALIYLSGRRYVQRNLVVFTRELIYELQLKILKRIFATSYQKFEAIDKGRIYTAINDDVDVIGQSSNMLVMLITSIFTAAGAFLFLGTIAFWAALLTIALIVVIAITYFLVSKSTNKYFEAARDTRNLFIRLVNGMVDGFKEISLHWNKRAEYREDIAAAADDYKVKISTANVRFVNAFLAGESLLIILLGVAVFAIPKLFSDVQSYTVMSFVVVLLYLIGPVNAILNSIPSVMQVRVAWRRIRQFQKDIPANLHPEENTVSLEPKVESIKAEGVRFVYPSVDGQDAFEVGPIDLEVRCGEILFIVGGNGSGKTTLAKLVAGLYEPSGGTFLLNDRPVSNSRLSEHISAVFSPAHLFEKLYNIETASKSGKIKRYLKVLGLEEKVEITGNKYSTIELSGGQRKRLALLQCYLEDSPIYLFDEWAADQDPGYRNFFYRTLLPEMRDQGKIVIAITHDDNYFSVADRIIKMDRGRLETYTGVWASSSESITPI